MSNFLMIGDEPPSYKAEQVPMPSSTQHLAIGSKIAQLNSAGHVTGIGMFDPLFEPLFDLGNGIMLAPWDILKGIMFGVLTKVGEKTMDIKYNTRKKNIKSFVNGFFIGGAAGGLETLLDVTIYTANQTSGPYAEVPSDIMVMHEFFQGIVFQGLIAGLTNLALTWAGV